MDDAYRAEKLAEARHEADRARARYDAEPAWNATKRRLSEELEFWTNRAAFLSHAS